MWREVRVHGELAGPAFGAAKLSGGAVPVTHTIGPIA